MNKSYAASLLVVATTAGSNNLSYASTDLAERLAAAQTALERAVERDLGLNAAQLRTYQKVEERAIRLRAKLIETQGGDYAGVFIKRNPAGVYRVVANGKNQADIKANPNETPDETRSVKYSLDDLREFNKRLVAHFVATSLISKINSIGINVEENRLDVRATKLHIGVVRAGVATSSIPQDAARLIEDESRPSDTQAIYGGEAFTSIPWKPDRGCSIGFPIYSDSRWGFASAGHCVSPSAPATYHWPSQSYIGNFTETFFPGQDFVYTWITNGSHPGEPFVYMHNGNHAPIYGNKEVPVGGAICRSGYNTGYRCGSKTIIGLTIYTTAGNLYTDMIGSSACVGPGDSGGSVISTSFEAQGINSGGVGPWIEDGTPNGSNCSIGNGSYYSALQRGLNSLSHPAFLRTLETCGRLSAGYRIGPGSILSRWELSSCNGQYKVKINPSNGWLTMYDWSQPTYPIVWVGTDGSLHMNRNGNLEAKRGNGTIVWQTSTYSPGSEFRLTHNGEWQVSDIDSINRKVYCPLLNSFQSCSDPY